MNQTAPDTTYATDFDLPSPEESLKEATPVNLTWDEIAAMFEEQRLAYMRDFYTPEERLRNKVTLRFEW